MKKQIETAARKTGPIGIIGLGLMGSALARRLQDGGFKILGWDIDSARIAQLKENGGAASESASEVLKTCSRVLLSLPDYNVSADVLREGKAHAHSGQIVIDTSTGDPDQAVELGAELARSGACYLDATISGSSAQATEGDVTLMVGGPKQAFEQCRDVFRFFSSHIFYLGPCGSGAKMKLLTNLVLGLNRAALAEGLAFAKALGLDLEQTLGVLRESPAYSHAVDVKGAKMLSQNFEPEARLSQHLKDVLLMIEAAKRAGMKLPLTETHQKLLEKAKANGLGDLDNSAIIRVFDAFIPKP